MMPPIDAVRNGMGFDEAGRWHQAKVLYMPASRRDDDPLAPARGALYGCLLSGVLWVVLFVAAHFLRSLF